MVLKTFFQKRRQGLVPQLLHIHAERFAGFNGCQLFDRYKGSFRLSVGRRQTKNDTYAEKIRFERMDIDLVIRETKQRA